MTPSKEFLPELLVTYEGPLQIIKLNRPSVKNALNRNMYVNIPKALEAGAANDAVRMTVMTGEGEYFSSGNDLVEAAQRYASAGEDVEVVLNQSLHITREFVNAFIGYPKLLIGIVNGPAIGIATSVLPLFDLVYATESATFHTPFTSLGITAEGCSTYTFPLILGPQLASKMLYFNHKMSAKEAKKHNFIADIIRKSEIPYLMTTLMENARLPIKSLVFTKQLVRNQNREILYNTNYVEVERLKERFGSEDAMEAMLKFMSKKSKL